MYKHAIKCCYSFHYNNVVVNVKPYSYIYFRLLDCCDILLYLLKKHTIMTLLKNILAIPTLW